MADDLCKRAFAGYHFSGEEENGNFLVYRLSDGTGSGEMASFEVCEGIQLTYNRLEMDSCFQAISPSPGFMQINHCLEGCFEFELQDGSVGFAGEGDLCVHDLGGQAFAGSRFPSRKYFGLTVLLELGPAQRSLDGLFPKAKIDLLGLRDILCPQGQSLFIRARSEVEHIFSELYCVDDRIREPYSLIKVVEILLYLGLADRHSCQHLPTFSPAVVKGTKEAYAYLTENPFRKTTIGELSAMFHVADSSLKRCFKAISGQTIGAFIKEKRIRAAADLLLEQEELSIGAVAELTGYGSQSKFSSAFKALMGQTPLVYRSQRKTCLT